MSKRIYFNAFHMNCVVHQSPGLWVHPDDQMHCYTDLNTWVHLAKLLGRGKFDSDQPLEYIETNAVRTLVHAFTEADPSRKWTMRDLARFVGIGGAGPVLVGAPEQIADSLQEWVRAGVDGFNLAYAITPGSFVDFIEGVVPVLQRRGLMQTDYEEGTLREKLFGKGHARLREPHPAARSRQRWGAPVNVPLEDSRHIDGSHSIPVAK